MKHQFLNTRVAHAALGAAVALAAGSAFAQTTVTLFGTADAVYRHTSTSGVASVNALASGAAGSSRWGLRGEEDIGSGLNASFWLEAPINIDTGETAGFTRRSTVSLTHRDFGELRLGRDYTPTHWSRFDPFVYVGIGSAQILTNSASVNTVVRAAFGTAPTTIQRVSNAVQYFLPQNSLGLDGSAFYSFQERGAAADDLHRTVGGRLGYTFGKLYVAAASLRTHNTATAPDAFKDTEIGATYNAELFKVSAALRRYDFRTARQNNWLVSTLVPMGPHEFKAMWLRAAMDGRIGVTSIDSNRSDQFSLGYVYSFSKSAKLYATWASIHNKGGSRFAVLGAPTPTANGQSSSGVDLGISKSF